MCHSLNVKLIFIIIICFNINVSWQGNEHKCGGTFKDLQTIIQSPGYPSLPKYPTNLYCEYIFKSPFSCPNEFHIQFLNFSLESSPNCYKDQLKIGHNEILCGHVIGIMKYKTLNGILKIIFKTDNTLEDKGFNIIVTRLSCIRGTVSPAQDYSTIYPIFKRNPLTEFTPNTEMEFTTEYIQTKMLLNNYTYQHDTLVPYHKNKNHNNNSNKPSADLLPPHNNNNDSIADRRQYIKSFHSSNNQYLPPPIEQIDMPPKSNQYYPQYNPSGCFNGCAPQIPGQQPVLPQQPPPPTTTTNILPGGYPYSPPFGYIPHNCIPSQHPNHYPQYPNAPNYPPPTYPQYPNTPNYPPPPPPTYPQYPQPPIYPNYPNIPPPQSPQYPPQQPPIYEITPFDGGNFNNNNNNVPNIDSNGQQPAIDIDSQSQIIPSIIPQCCRNTFRQKRFYLVSPGFPNRLPRQNIDCLFMIERNNPNICRLRIELKFFLFGFYDNRLNNCYDNFIEIDGKRLCGCQSGVQYISQWGIGVKIIRMHINGLQHTINNNNNAIQGFIIDVYQEECPYRILRDNNNVKQNNNNLIDRSDDGNYNNVPIIQVIPAATQLHSILRQTNSSSLIRYYFNNEDQQQNVTTNQPSPLLQHHKYETKNEFDQRAEQPNSQFFYPLTNGRNNQRCNFSYLQWLSLAADQFWLQKPVCQYLVSV